MTVFIWGWFSKVIILTETTCIFFHFFTAPTWICQWCLLPVTKASWFTSSQFHHKNSYLDHRILFNKQIWSSNVDICMLLYKPWFREFVRRIYWVLHILSYNLVYSSMCLIILLLLQLEYLGDAGIPSFKQIEFLTRLAFFP